MAYVATDEVPLTQAPQGGLGLQGRIRTTGLAADAPVSLEFETWLDGALAAEFTSDSVQLFCNEADDSGMVWGAVFPFGMGDPTAADGRVAELRLTATDFFGESASGNATVVIDVPE